MVLPSIVQRWNSFTQLTLRKEGPGETLSPQKILFLHQARA
jgi:hypothetical protein